MNSLDPQLKVFLCVANSGTIRQAAKALGISEKGVSKKIQLLEKTYSSILFKRSQQRLLLTAEGEALLRYCQAAMDLEGEALAKIEGARI